MMWLFSNLERVWELTLDHIWLSAVPTLVGLILALPIGMLVHPVPALRRVVVTVCSITFTIPSLALFVVIPSIIGTKILDPLNVIVALTLYSVALLTRSVLDSLDAVPQDVQAAAEAMGMSKVRRSLGIDLPLAIPVLVAGTRVVAVTNVSLVSVGAVIGIGGLGQLFTSGYQRDYPDQILAGIIMILVLAFVFDRLLALAGAILTPWMRVESTQNKPKVPKTEQTQTAFLAVVSEEDADVR